MDPPKWELDQLAAEAAGEAGALLSAGPYRSVPVAVYLKTPPPPLDTAKVDT